MGEGSSGNGAQIIEQNEVILDGAVSGAMDPIEHVEDWTDPDVQTGFLSNFAHDRTGERFADFHGPARETPLAL